MIHHPIGGKGCAPGAAGRRRRARLARLARLSRALGRGAAARFYFADPACPRRIIEVDVRVGTAAPRSGRHRSLVVGPIVLSAALTT